MITKDLNTKAMLLGAQISDFASLKPDANASRNEIGNLIRDIRAMVATLNATAGRLENLRQEKETQIK